MSQVTQAPPAAGGLAAYDDKTDRYFAGARQDWVTELPTQADARILEIGCGNGDTGRAARTHGKCGWYAGVEICPQAADLARAHLDEVIEGDVERVKLPWPDDHFDVVLLSEVLEHLVDPWAVLRRLHGLVRIGGLVFASSPNVAHHSVIRMLLRGNWTLTDVGVMDRTHLRWFTPRSYRALFETCGYEVMSVRPHAEAGWRTRLAQRLLFGQAGWLFHRQSDLRAYRPRQQEEIRPPCG